MSYRHTEIRAAAFGLLLILIMGCLTAAAFAEEETIGTLESTLYGTNEPGSTVEETILGDVIADALRAQTGADFAVIPGGIIYYNLQGGDVTETELRELLSDDQQVVLTQMTAAELKQFLENGVSHTTIGSGDLIDEENSKFDGFPQISGFSFKYDASALAGERVLSITADESDTAMDTDDESQAYTVALTEELADGTYGYTADSYELTEWTVTDCLVVYFTDAQISVPTQERITCIGTASNSLISQLPAGTWIAICAILIGVYTMFRRVDKKPSASEEFSDSLQDKVQRK